MGPDVMGKSESEEREGNSRLHASIRNGKCVCAGVCVCRVALR